MKKATGSPNAKTVLAISVHKCYKTTCKPTHSPTVMTNIISKCHPYVNISSKYMYIVGLQNCCKWQKLTGNKGLAVLAQCGGCSRTIQTTRLGGWQYFCCIYEKGMNLSKVLGRIQLKINAQHAQKRDQERVTNNSSEIGNKLTKAYANLLSISWWLFIKELPNRMHHYIT